MPDKKPKKEDKKKPAAKKPAARVTTEKPAKGDAPASPKKKK
jgi:hypothetical protein